MQTRTMSAVVTTEQKASDQVSADTTPIVDDTLAAVVDSSDSMQTHTMSAVVTTEQKAPEQVSADATPVVSDTLAAVVDNSRGRSEELLPLYARSRELLPFFLAIYLFGQNLFSSLKNNFSFLTFFIFGAPLLF